MGIEIKSNVPLDRDIFLRSLVRELAGVLEDVVGYSDASGYIGVVGQNIGEWINELYKKEIGVSTLDSFQVAWVLVDLKRKIQGDFRLIEQDSEKIVLSCNACPFGEKVLDRPSMCMMTSNVFGVITAENLGYAKVVLKKTIARGDGKCEVIVYLTPSLEAEKAEGREYFRSM